MSAAQLCHTDEFGLLDYRCLWVLQDAESRAYARGYAAGRRDVYAEIDADVRKAAAGARQSINVLAARESADARWSA